MASVLPSFIFGGNTGVSSPDDLARRRALAEALLNRGQAGGAASNVGEGLAQLGAALGGRFRLEGVRGEERKAKASASDLFRSLMTGQGGTQPMAQAAATVTPASAPVPASAPKGRNGFLGSITPAAVEHGRKIGVDPRIIVAQAALESGWGAKAPGNNYFGIKSHGKPGGQTFATHEIVNGKRVNLTDSFRQFESPADSVAGYADFLTSNPRYKPMLAANGDLDAQLAALGQSGYATDPNYTAKLASIIQTLPPDLAAMATAQAAPPSMGMSFNGPPTTLVPAAAPSPLNVIPASASAPRQPMQQAPQTAYERMMATANAKDGVPMPSHAPQAMQPQMAPQMPPAMQPASMASQGAPQPMQPGNRMSQIAAAIGDPSFGFLEPLQQKFLLDEYQREMEAANPDPMKALQMRKLQAEVDQMQNPGANTEYGLNPQFGVDADGNPVMIQVGKNGQAVQTQMPPDVKLSREPIKFDAGTHFVLLDPVTRQPIGTIPKDLAGAEKQKEIGTAQGKAAGAATSDIATADMALDILDSIENDPNLSWGVGRSSVFNFIPGSPGLDFQNKVDQATSGAFLSAIQQMRGLGALSNAEGSTATKAVTRMSTSTSEEAFRNALSDYRKLVQLGRERAVAMANGGAPGVPAPDAQPGVPQGGPVSVDGFTIKRVK